MNPQTFLKNHKIEPKKEEDQYFLGNEDILNLEVELANLKKDDTVLEIGAGFGNLTEKLSKKCKVIAIEKDPRFVPFLEKIENVEVEYGNAINIIKNKKLEFNKIVSNIPYSVSQKLLLELLKRKWETAVVIVQKEFAEKMTKNSKLSLLLKNCCNIKIKGVVPDQAFYPRAITSALVVIKQKKIMNEKFWYFLKQLFRYNNKNIDNALEYLNIKYQLEKEKKNKKVHQLNLKEIKNIYKSWQNER